MTPAFYMSGQSKIVGKTATVEAIEKLLKK
jgi:hypothetical protein